MKDAEASEGRPAEFLLGRTCRLDLRRPRIMGILNVTPDSFSDGGRFCTPGAALERARQMAAEGADIIDIGGESSRPGSLPVSTQEELDRVLPVVELLAREIDLPLSVDTTKSAVARAAIASGAEFINDIGGLTFDSEMADCVAAARAGLFLMHTRARPREMQQDVIYDDVVAEVVDALQRSLQTALAAGIDAERLAVDPGIGFSKDAAGNLELLRRLEALTALGRPVLLGTSRKNFIGRVVGRSDPADRLYGSVATVALGVAKGARILRVHDVAASRDAALMAWAVSLGQAWHAT